MNGWEILWEATGWYPNRPARARVQTMKEWLDAQVTISSNIIIYRGE